MTKDTRVLTGNDQLGAQRYRRYVAAFDHVMHCCEHGYYLEAIAVLDSLISDRLASRLSHLLDEEVPVRYTVGQLCKNLLGPRTKNAPQVEVDSAFQTVVEEIQAWGQERNRAMHATAKIIRNDDDISSFNEVLDSHRSIVDKGIRLLQSFDTLDTEARRKNRKYPATWPYAFFPNERQTLTTQRSRVRSSSSGRR